MCCNMPWNAWHIVERRVLQPIRTVVYYFQTRQCFVSIVIIQVLWIWQVNTHKQISSLHVGVYIRLMLEQHSILWSEDRFWFKCLQNGFNSLFSIGHISLVSRSTSSVMQSIQPGCWFSWWQWDSHAVCLVRQS